LTGSDDFQIKVSAYGATWFDALQLERTSGRVSVLAAMRLNPLAGDPGTVADGDLWYNCSTGTFRNRQHRVSIDLLSSAAATAAYGGLQANYLLTSDTTAQKLFNCSTVQLFNCSTGRPMAPCRSRPAPIDSPVRCC
jgi:hypothetical protein